MSSENLKLDRAINVAVVSKAGQAAMLKGSYYANIWAGIFAEAGLGCHRVVALQFSPECVRDQFMIATQDFSLKGAIVIGVNDRTFVSDSLASGLPMIVADHQFDDLEVDCVDIDSHSGALRAVEHLVSLGHKSIGFVGTNRAEDNPWRFNGFKDGLKEAGLELNESWLFQAQPSEQGGLKCIQSVLDSGQKLPTALLAGDDFAGVGVITGLEERGLSVPEDISVMACGHCSFSQLYARLTLSAVDAFEMGCLAFKTLIERIAQPDKATGLHLLTSKLVEAKTTGPVPQGS
jgi:DNA-binding LacI/PurR family transcriptional regulator